MVLLAISNITALLSDPPPRQAVIFEGEVGDVGNEVAAPDQVGKRITLATEVVLFAAEAVGERMVAVEDEL